MKHKSLFEKLFQKVNDPITPCANCLCEYCKRNAEKGCEYQSLPDKDFEEKAKRALLQLHEIGGCDAQDSYSKSWDAAITEAIKILEEETGIRIEEVLD